MNWQRQLLVWASAVAGAGCAVVESVDGARYRVGSAGFRGYVERVFREQNSTGDRLAFALEDLGSAHEATRVTLSDAEVDLIRACRDLNRLAVSQRDGVPLGARESLAAARTAPDCERANRAALAVLDELDQ